MKSLLLFSFLLCTSFFVEKEYVKNYYPNGKLKEEGWIKEGKKNDYWFFYYETGLKKQEGHYANNLKTNWWIFYDVNEIVEKKCEYKNNILNGLMINYKNGKIINAEKYNKGKRIKQWTSFSEFKKDNPYSF